MKSKPVLVLTLLVILPLSMPAYGAQQQTTPPEVKREEVEKLNAQVKQLTAQITQLQESVRKLETRIDELYRWTMHPSKK
ncbi:MAG: hypothetical protein HYV05_09010 [Deltaproteobacteria bacterium]|nr:hypothetical protein [Deltaproteobacteria bacterium]